MSDDEMLAHYSAALDEVYNLRALLAVYADHTEADLTYKTYPKGRREIVENRIVGMRRAARGEVDQVLAGRDTHRTKLLLKRAGAGETLTRWQWEEKRGCND